MPYMLSKRQVMHDGPKHHPVETFNTYNAFQHAWAYAQDLFASLGFIVIGCHLEPEFPHEPAYAEFWVHAKPDIHETYVIRHID